MTLRVSFDSQIFRMQRRGGISRYFTELLNAFHTNPGLEVEPVLRARLIASQHLAEAGLGRHLLVHPRILHHTEEVATRLSKKPRDIDLIHHTYYSSRFLQRAPSVPRVSTIHDMIPELVPEFFPHGNPHQAKRQYVEQSDGLVFVSETSRRDLSRIFGPIDVPSAVTHLAPSSEFYPRNPENDHGSYAIFVGSRGGYKDFGTLLSALALVPSRDLALIAVGGGPFTPNEFSRMDALGLIGRVRHLSVTDSELAKLYGESIGLVMPSLYEGFGLPVVEAMASGCPVVLSDTEIFREVAGEAAQFFSAKDALALSEILDRLTHDASLRRAMKRSSIVRSKDFSWSRTARVTAHLYREVLAAR